jgi:8-oxo-dGTP diphosphatase
MAQRQYQVAVALVRRDEKVLLVQQQGPDDERPSWTLPGGAVEEGELLTEALVREVREETGLEILKARQLAYVAQVDNVVGGTQSLTFVFEIDDWRGTLAPSDPDKLIMAAAFIPLPEAVGKIEDLPWRVMREPLVAYLRGEVEAGSVWLYRRQADGTEELVTRLLGSDTFSTVGRAEDDSRKDGAA